MNQIFIFLAAGATYAVLDFIWLGMIMSGFYLREMSEIAHIVDGKIKPNLFGAGMVYLILSLGIVFFVVPKVEIGGGFLQAFLWGAFLGLIVYGVYDWTNYAVLKNYGLLLTIVDMAWGGFVSGAAAMVSIYVRDHLT